VIDGFSLYKPRITTWIADGVEDVFEFKAGELPTDNAYKVYSATAGVVTEVVSGISKTTANIDFTSAPADGVKIMVPHMIA
jgi:hypothetical protein